MLSCARHEDMTDRAGQIGAGNQRIGRQHAALVVAVLLRGFAVWTVQPRAPHFNLGATESADQ
jgi:hypothetical protein